MGEIADMMVNGTLCESCDALIDGETVGYVRYCEECKEEEK